MSITHSSRKCCNYPRTSTRPVLPACTRDRWVSSTLHHHHHTDYPGKWWRTHSISTTHQVPGNKGAVRSVYPGVKAAVIGGIERPHIAKESMYDSSEIINFHELFNVGNAEVPFEKELQLVRIDGNLIWIWAMVNVIDAGIFATLRDCLSTCKPSCKVLQMANGTLVASKGSWTGTVIIRDVQVVGTFEIFPSKSLFGCEQSTVWM